MSFAVKEKEGVCVCVDIYIFCKRSQESCHNVRFVRSFVLF